MFDCTEMQLIQTKYLASFLTRMLQNALLQADTNKEGYYFMISLLHIAAKQKILMIHLKSFC